MAWVMQTERTQQGPPEGSGWLPSEVAIQRVAVSRIGLLCPQNLDEPPLLPPQIHMCSCCVLF